MVKNPVNYSRDEQLVEFWTYLKQQPHVDWQPDKEALLSHADPTLNGKRVVIQLIKDLYTAVVQFVEDLTQSLEVKLVQLKPIT
jgi:hypothetical protein